MAKKTAAKKKSTAKAPAKAKAKAKPKAKAKASAAAAGSDAEAILQSFHRVLRNKEVEQPVKLQLSAAAGGLCWVWRCVTLANGTRRCSWVQEPC